MNNLALYQHPYHVLVHNYGDPIFNVANHFVHAHCGMDGFQFVPEADLTGDMSMV